MAKRRWLRRHSLERRLFGWLLALALVPALALIALAAWTWTRSLAWLGGAAPWESVAASGRALFAAADTAALDTALATVLQQHREELSSSLLLARRWSFVSERVAASIPLAALAVGTLIVALALLASRRLARELARPIKELVDWTGQIARDEPLPAPRDAERREVREFRVLREAFRVAAYDLGAARQRAVAAERLRVWGEMARRVAHEMKNPLTPLRLASRRLESSSTEAMREDLAVIREETARLEELAAQFAALGRPAAGPRSEVDVRELVAALLATDVPPIVEATLDAPADVPHVQAHYEELVRVLRNLIKNAVEAMEGCERRRLEVTIRRADDAVDIVVADSGRGLPEGTQEQVFEPDFSTKQRGTGLGLALVRQGVHTHGGSVEARNRAGGGAEFRVRLPATSAGSGALPSTVTDHRGT